MTMTVKRHPVFRVELYRHLFGGELLWDFRIIRRRGGKTVATSHGQAYSRHVDAVRTLRALGFVDADIVDVPFP